MDTYRAWKRYTCELPEGKKPLNCLHMSGRIILKLKLKENRECGLIYLPPGCISGEVCWTWNECTDFIEDGDSQRVKRTLLRGFNYMPIKLPQARGKILHAKIHKFGKHILFSRRNNFPAARVIMCSWTF